MKEISALTLKLNNLEQRIDSLEELLKIKEKKKSFFSVNEYAELFGLSPMTVYSHIRAGNIEAIKIGKTWRIPNPLK